MVGPPIRRPSCCYGDKLWDSHECNVILSRNCSHIYVEGDDIMTNESLANNAACSIVNAQDSFVDSSVDVVIDDVYLATSLLHPETSDSAIAMTFTENQDGSDSRSKLYIACCDAVNRSLYAWLYYLPCWLLKLNTQSKCDAVIGLKEFQSGWDPPWIDIIGDSRFGFG